MPACFMAAYLPGAGALFLKKEVENRPLPVSCYFEKKETENRPLSLSVSFGNVLCLSLSVFCRLSEYLVFSGHQLPLRHC